MRKVTKCGVISHRVRLQRKRESPVRGFAVARGLRLAFLLQLVQVEHIIEAVVVVADDVEDHVAAFLEGVHVMVHHHLPRVVLSHLFAGLSVDQVNQRLKKKEEEEEI